jgi:predicted membrane-bound dolichyl-phosphate-mannose-protein mannosyltransferase
LVKPQLEPPDERSTPITRHPPGLRVDGITTTALGDCGPAQTASHRYWLWLLLLAAFLLRMLWLAQPEGALIFDEKYYVNAARVLLAIPPQGIYEDKTLGLDPNTEHPPLAKLIVAGSMHLLGDNAYGWRLPSVIVGTASIGLLYGIARRVRLGPTPAIVAAALLAFDNLAFVHSRIFTLDIFLLGFLLLGAYWYLGGRPALAGVGFALAALCKINGALGLVAIAGYEALRLLCAEQPRQAGVRTRLGLLTRMVLAFLIAFAALLGAMDRRWVGYDTPVEHVRRIVTYGAALNRPSGPSGVESYPWQWLWNAWEMPYLRYEQQLRAGDEIRESRPVILFLGAMNPFVLMLWPLSLSFAGWAWWRRRPGGAAGAFALAWFTANYLPFYATTLLGQRISYLFYFLPALPAVVLASSYLLFASGLPRIVAWAYLAAVLAGFYGYFPFKMLG